MTNNHSTSVLFGVEFLLSATKYLHSVCTFSTLSSRDASDLGSCPAKLSFQGLHPYAALMWGHTHRGVCAWHLPNMLKTVSHSVCLSVSNWHTPKQTHAGTFTSLTRAPLGWVWAGVPTASGCIVYTLQPISCSPPQTLSARIKNNWPSGVVHYDICSFLWSWTLFLKEGPFLFVVCL